MAYDFSSIRYPELVFGIAGPIGIDIDAISASLSDALHTVDYKSIPIRLTEEIASVRSDVKLPVRTDYYSQIKYKMDHTSQLCRDNDDPAWAMRFVVDAIRRKRGQLVGFDLVNEDHEQGDAPFVDVGREDKIQQRVAYIIRQIKRPEEVKLLRDIYGKQFVLISAFAAEEDRVALIAEKIKRTLPLATKKSKISAFAEALVLKDASEDTDEYGQHLRDAFHLADVFVDGLAVAHMRAKIDRFIGALFGLNDITPTKTEYGMYAAKAASLRSADLSRQVGAAIFSSDGELITQGCNEVPKAFGGNYWDTEEPDFRDVKIGSDPNDILKKEVLRDILERLESNKLLSNKALELASSGGQLIDVLLRKPKENDDVGVGCLNGSLISDLTEFGRVVHAEMNAICDAARLGKPIKGSVLFCTAFPCHNCTKHVLASGISRVFFLEPYPKSRAKELHSNEIELGNPSIDRVSFHPFLGISPHRYRDIFEKGKRKKDGSAEKWYYGDPVPMIDVIVPNYTRLELFATAKIFGNMIATVGEGQV
ncbi:anti-phage dCTP deaminase [Sphingomonas sp. PvP018]|uniref:anti-phage dCTP deaminase n=1 Tax=Sphingomonas sp. PvP018 TaxID=2817852 RepID=UPI001AEA5B15|nr:deoxycytidylate deaminase [Sphingomonas sp. PvP018]